MDNTFNEATKFNQNISGWNLAAATTLERFLYNADGFNQDISAWDVSRVTNMEYMFRSTAFNQDLCLWGSKISISSSVNFMFSSTACPNQGNPNLSATPPGPFCYNC